MEIRTVLLTASFEGAHWERLRAALGPARVLRVYDGDAEALEAALAEADVAILRGDLDGRYLGRERLRWVHCSHAGIEKSARPEVFDEGLLVTGAAGRSAVRLIV